MFASMHDTAQELRNTVGRFLERTGISPSKLGRKAVNNPSFVFRLLKGSSPRLKTADRVLKAMGLEPIGPRFRREMKAYLTITGANRSAPGREVLNDTSFVRRVLKGSSSPELKTVDRVRDWMRQSTNAEEWRLIETAAAASDDASAGDDGDRLFPDPGEAPYMIPCEVASVLNVTERTLGRWRDEGRGPEFYQDGRFVRYARAKVDLWMRSIERSSSSDPGKPPPERGTDEPLFSPESG